MILRYNPRLKNKASHLRKNMTWSEVKLWRYLKNKKIGYDFHRQKPIDNFIVDFYCPKLRLVIEIDDFSHTDEKADYDKERQDKLESLGLTYYAKAKYGTPLKRGLHNNMKNRYDIITISHFFYPRVGGLENMAYGMSKALNDKGLKVFSLHGGDRNFKYYLDGFAGESIKVFSLFNGTYPIFGLRFFVKVIKLLTNNPKATVILHYRHLLSSFVASTVCFLLRRKYMLVSHTTKSNYFKSNLL